MRYDWDTRKNVANIRKHGVDFAKAGQIFDGPIYTYLDSRRDYGELRRIGIGWMGQRLITVVFVEHGDDLIRIISARKSTRREERLYEQNVESIG